MARRTEILQYRYVADRIMAACELQYERVTSEHDRSATPSLRIAADLDFYVLSLARLGELIRKVANKLQISGAEEVWDEFRADFPEVITFRDWLMHPAEPKPSMGDRAVSDETTIWVRREGTGWQRTLDVREDHHTVRAYYDRICELLGGDLPGTVRIGTPLPGTPRA